MVSIWWFQLNSLLIFQVLSRMVMFICSLPCEQNSLKYSYPERHVCVWGWGWGWVWRSFMYKDCWWMAGQTDKVMQMSTCRLTLWGGGRKWSSPIGKLKTGQGLSSSNMVNAQRWCSCSVKMTTLVQSVWDTLHNRIANSSTQKQAKVHSIQNAHLGHVKITWI